MQLLEFLILAGEVGTALFFITYLGGLTWALLHQDKAARAMPADRTGRALVQSARVVFLTVLPTLFTLMLIHP